MRAVGESEGGNQAQRRGQARGLGRQQLQITSHAPIPSDDVTPLLRVKSDHFSIEMGSGSYFITFPYCPHECMLLFTAKASV